MVKASPYVIKNISMVLKKKDLVEAEELLNKFRARYSEDTELLKICEEYSEYLKTRDLKRINDVKSSLKRLKSTRMLGISGSDRLWFKDRRPNLMQVIQVT